jgi:hypothetical protein
LSGSPKGFFVESSSPKGFFEVSSGSPKGFDIAAAGLGCRAVLAVMAVAFGLMAGELATAGVDFMNLFGRNLWTMPN